MVPVPSFSEALRFWVKLGFISFGGPAGQISIMQHELVDQRRWIDQQSFLQGLNFCMLLPGPEAQQLATYIGWKLHGIKGGLAAGILFVLPGAVILYLLAWLAAVHGDAALVRAVFDGLKPVVLAVVVHAVWRISQRTLNSGMAFVLAIGAFMALEIGRVPFPLVVVTAGAVGWIAARLSKPEELTHRPSDVVPINDRSVLRRLAGMALLYFGLLMIPIGVVIAFAGPEPYLGLSKFFTKAAFVTFGGAYAVLPYVADVAVNQFQWISPDQMINGLALAETTPGPLILVLQYVGFFAGWNNAGDMHPLATASLAAIVTTYATFLPSIFLIVAGAPYIARISAIRSAAGALAAITAAVVGVIATLAFFLGRQVIVSASGQLDLVSTGLAVAALVLLTWHKIKIHWLVMLGGLVGLGRFAFG